MADGRWTDTPRLLLPPLPRSSLATSSRLDIERNYETVLPSTRPDLSFSLRSCDNASVYISAARAQVHVRDLCGITPPPSLPPGNILRESNFCVFGASVCSEALKFSIARAKRVQRDNMYKLEAKNNAWKPRTRALSDARISQI